MEGDEGGIFSKGPDWKYLFFLNETEAGKIQYLSTVIRISEPIPEL